MPDKLELKPGHPAERSIYATRDGRLVEQDDPEATELVVGAGGVVTEKMAARYRGGGGEPAPVASDAPAPPESAAADEADEADESGQRPPARGRRRGAGE